MGQIGGQAKQKSVISMDNGKIRMELQGSIHIIMIFDSSKQVMWTITPERGTYMEVNADTPAAPSMSDQRQAQMDAAMKKMQEQMASMPPEQRAQMEKMMKGMTNGASAATTPNLTYRSLGTTDKVGQFTCSNYEALNNGKRFAEHCTATLDQLHLTADDFRTFEAMGKFMKAHMGSRASAAPAIVEEMKGFPVRTVTYMGDKPNFESTVISVEHKSVDSSLFTVPSGLKKEDPMAGRGGMSPR
jgi:hypothetical protein